MDDKNIGQKVECDQCIWEGYENELEHIIDGDNSWDQCPACGEVSISYMGHD